MLSKDKVEFIRQNCMIMRDQDIADRLGCQLATVVRWRKKLGIQKGRLGKIVDVSRDTSIRHRMSEEEKKEFFKTQLSNSLYYDQLKNQFSPAEMDFYLEEWASLCVQFQDIVQTEKRQIDELIKTEIMDNRLLRNIKIIEDEIELLVKEVENLRKNHNDEDDNAVNRDQAVMELISLLSGEAKSMVKDHNVLVSTKASLLNELNARRKDRLDQLRKPGTTFLSMIEAFQDERTREVTGRHMELVRMAKEKKKNDWLKPKRFLDGEMDNILLTDESIPPDEEDYHGDNEAIND